MNKMVSHLIAALPILFLMISCDLITELQSGSSKLTFKAAVIGEKVATTDTIVFNGKNIKSFNGTTGEVAFADSMTISKLNSYRRIVCYLESDSLFAFRVTSDIMSSIVNDLVLNHNLYDGKYYFLDGYPPLINNTADVNMRILNKEKRSMAWTRFIEELKWEGKLKK